MRSDSSFSSCFLSAHEKVLYLQPTMILYLNALTFSSLTGGCSDLGNYFRIIKINIVLEAYQVRSLPYIMIQPLCLKIRERRMTMDLTANYAN